MPDDMPPPAPAPPLAPPPGGPLPQPNLIDLIKVLADKIDPIIKVITTTLDHRQKEQESEIKFQIHMSWTGVSVIFLIVLVSAFLTYKGKIDGSTFTFLLGLIVGYMLTFVRDQIKGGE
jgi:hypothetical protein